MKEKSLPDQISHLMNDTPEMDASPVEENTDEQKDILVENLKAAAGQTDGALDAALDEFLDGKGVLHETTRAALTRGGGGLNEVIQLLTKQFKLSPAVAKMIASLILKLQPSGSKETAKKSTAKKKPRRKTKPKTAKKETISAKKAKKKTTAKAKKSTSKTKPRSTKKTASKATAKKKTSTKTGKKKTAAKPKPKKAKRTSTVEIP